MPAGSDLAPRGMYVAKLPETPPTGDCDKNGCLGGHCSKLKDVTKGYKHWFLNIQCIPHFCLFLFYLQEVLFLKKKQRRANQWEKNNPTAISVNPKPGVSQPARSRNQNDLQQTTGICQQQKGEGLFCKWEAKDSLGMLDGLQ